MGRGRQKAKHTKIARELKSFSPSVNYSALERELAHADADENSYEDKWADDVNDAAGDNVASEEVVNDDVVNDGVVQDDEAESEGEEEAPTSSASHAAR